jgi:hypothetical protein
MILFMGWRTLQPDPLEIFKLVMFLKENLRQVSEDLTAVMKMQTALKINLLFERIMIFCIPFLFLFKNSGRGQLAFKLFIQSLEFH